MRIPVYRSQTQATSQAPGRSIQSRMRGDLLAQAELRKGDVGAAALETIGAYAKMRYGAEQEVLLSEALLTAEEGLRTAARDLSKSSRLSDVFGGENLWSQQSEEIKQTALEAIGKNRFTTQKFNDRFGQMELTTRFSLKNSVDARMEAMAQRAMATRQNSAVANLSELGIGNSDEMIANYNATIYGIEVDQGTGVKQGRYNPELINQGNIRMKAAIAQNVVLGVVGSDPLLAAQLIDALEYQDILDSGADPSAYGEPPQIPGAAYALHTLRNIPRGDAVEIVAKSITQANKFAKLRQDQEDRQEAAFEDAIVAATNRFEFFDDPYALYDASELTRFIPGISSIMPEGAEEVSGQEARDLIVDFLNTLNAITPSIKDRFEKASEISPESAFPAKSDDRVFTNLSIRATNGTLTYEEVDSERFLLSRPDYLSLRNRVGTEIDQSVSDQLAIAKSVFRYDELSALDPELGQASKAAYFSVESELLQTVQDRKTQGNPMIPVEIQEYAKSLIDKQQTFFEQQARSDFEGYLDLQNIRLGATGLDISTEDPLGSLDDWYNNLSPEDQARQTANYSRIKNNLKTYKSKGVF